MKSPFPQDEITYELGSFADDSGRILYWNGRVFREVLDDASWELYRKLLGSPTCSKLLANGLIETWIPNESGQEPGKLLEHKKIDFITYPPEWTLRMLWEAARTYMRCAGILAREGLIFADCHPWNVLFDFSQPRLIDFGAISDRCSSVGWIDGLRMFFIQPLWLARYGRSRGGRIAKEMMREHIFGVGPALIHMRAARFIPPAFYRLMRSYRRAVESRNRSRVVHSLEKMSEYVEQLKPPDAAREIWADYPQTTEADGKLTEKHKVVLEFLGSLHPESVLDMGTNKGWYALMAESLGAKVVAFDYEEYCVDQLYRLSRAEKKKILPLHMNFLYPTPQSGHALSMKTSFERLQCEVSLVLALIHHVALKQGAKFEHIAEIVSRYSRKAAIVEFVPPGDKHLTDWKIPPEYTKEGFLRAMAGKGFVLTAQRPLLEDKRDMLLFTRKP